MSITVDIGRQIHSPLLGDQPTERWVSQLGKKVPTPGSNGVPTVVDKETLVARNLKRRWEQRIGQKNRYLKAKGLTEEGRKGRGSIKEYRAGRKAVVKYNYIWLQFTPEAGYSRLETIMEDQEEEAEEQERKKRQIDKWKEVWGKAGKERLQSKQLTPVRKSLNSKAGQVNKIKEYFTNLGGCNVTGKEPIKTGKAGSSKRRMNEDNIKEGREGSGNEGREDPKQQQGRSSNIWKRKAEGPAEGAAEDRGRTQKGSLKKRKNEGEEGSGKAAHSKRKEKSGYGIRLFLVSRKHTEKDTSRETREERKETAYAGGWKAGNDAESRQIESGRTEGNRKGRFTGSRGEGRSIQEDTVKETGLVPDSLGIPETRHRGKLEPKLQWTEKID